MTVLLFRNLLSILSIRRVWNAILILISYGLSRLVRRPVVLALPVSVTIEPTSICNLRCPECPSGARTLKRPGGFADLAQFRALVDEISPRVPWLQLFFQGEPFLHKELPAMIEHAISRRMFVSISTNAHFLSRPMADTLIRLGVQRLIVSLDGVSEESYTAYRVGGSLSTVLDALHNLREARRAAPGHRTEIVVQFLATRYSEQEIPEVRRLAKDYEARLAVKTMQVYSTESAKKFLPRDSALSRYQPGTDTLRTLAPPANTCTQLWLRSVVTWDGRLVPCCFDKDAEYSFGNVFSSPFPEVWRSPAFHAFRNRILHERGAISMCENCTEGLKIYRQV